MEAMVECNHQYLALEIMAASCPQKDNLLPSSLSHSRQRIPALARAFPTPP